jgi:hypothetical protein
MTDYIAQGARFEVIEGLGCTNAINDDGLGILLVDSWQITIPLYAIIIYCCKLVAITFIRSYLHSI